MLQSPHIGDRSFSIAGPCLWNSLPVALRDRDSHLYSLRDFWRHFSLCTAAAHSDCCFFCAVYKNSYLLTYLLTYFSSNKYVLRLPAKVGKETDAEERFASELFHTTGPATTDVWPVLCHSKSLEVTTALVKVQEINTDLKPLTIYLSFFQSAFSQVFKKTAFTSHHHHVACPELDVAVRTSLLHACRFCARW